MTADDEGLRRVEEDSGVNLPSQVCGRTLQADGRNRPRPTPARSANVVAVRRENGHLRTRKLF